MKSFCWPLLLAALLVVPNVAGAGETPSQKSAAPAAQSATAPPAESAAAKYLLRYKFHAGEEIRSKVAQLATVETTIGGTTQTTDLKSYSTKLWRITAVNAAGNMTIEHSVENVDMRNRMSGRQEVHYNSRTDLIAPLGYEDVAKSIGKVLSVVTIGPGGNVIKRDDKQLRAISEHTGSVLIPPLPKDPAAIGLVWSAPLEVNVALEGGAVKPIRTRQRYELEKVERGVATIAVETQILTPVNDPKIRVQLMQRLSKGHIRFDIDAGRIVSQRTDLDQRMLGFSGPDSSMHYVATFTEDLLPATPKTAAAHQAANAPHKK